MQNESAQETQPISSTWKFEAKAMRRFRAAVEMIHRAIHFNKRVAFTDDNLK